MVVVVTVDDLMVGRRLPGPIEVTVTDVVWNPVKRRRALVEFVDARGNESRIVDYERAGIDENWKEGYRYRVSNCRVNQGGGSFEIELSTSKATSIVALGLASPQTRILVVGDTHIGRTVHPGTGDPIDPLGAFQQAIERGISESVDAMIHVGDLLHETATPGVIELVKQQVLTEFVSHDLPLLYVHGNHAVDAEKQLFRNFGGEYHIHLDTRGHTVSYGVRVYGFDHHESGDIPWEHVEFPNRMHEQVSILVLHQTLEQLSGPKSDAVDLRRIQGCAPGHFDAIFCGHHHDVRTLDWNGSRVVYTGAAEHLSTLADPLDRVAWIVTIDGGSIDIQPFTIPE